MQVFAISPFSFVPEKGERKFRRILPENPEDSELGGARFSALRSVWVCPATAVPACIEVGRSHHPPVLFPWPRKIARARPCTVNPPASGMTGTSVRRSYRVVPLCTAWFALQSSVENVAIAFHKFHDRFVHAGSKHFFVFFCRHHPHLSSAPGASSDLTSRRSRSILTGEPAEQGERTGSSEPPSPAMAAGTCPAG